MKRFARDRSFLLRCSAAFAAVGGMLPSLAASAAEPVSAEAKAFVTAHCLRCHGRGKVEGEVDFSLTMKDSADFGKHFKIWKQAAERVADRSMPPEDEPQPKDAEREAFLTWNRLQLASTAARPAAFRARRLSAVEYRRTIESLFGFPLEAAAAAAEQTKIEKSLVMKLLPVDPKGASGFTNDTRGNPITPLAWERYGYLAEAAVLKLFGPEGKASLEAMAGPIPADGLQEPHAIRLLERFQAKAWRRPIPSAARLERLKPLAGKRGPDLAAALQRELKLILMSPEFLYRGFLVEPRPGETVPADSFELSERLSYFLWADMPDEELSAAAAAGGLSDPQAYRKQIDRMLDSPKARSLAEVFGTEWLLLDEIDNASREIAYASALKGQPIEFLHDLVSRDRPLRELIDSRTEFVNLYLAGYYHPDRARLSAAQKRRPGVEVETLPLERIELEGTAGRGGLLTMPGVLMMNKGPVQRGTWVLERILGDHLGEPPPNVPAIKPAKKGEALSFREQFAAHRANRSCAVCHDRIDPLGFAFEAYNEQGGYRRSPDLAKQAPGGGGRGEKFDPDEAARIEDSGVLPSGEKFKDLEELKAVLAGSQWRRVVENLVRRTLAYALCRELELADEPVVAELADRLAKPGATWRSLIHAVADSPSFRQARFPADAEPSAPAGKRPERRVRPARPPKK